MNNYFRRLIAIICIVSILSTSVFAATQASDQLESYETDVTHVGDGELAILVSVFATNTMDSLGASNIFIYQQVGSSWVACGSVSRTYPGMTSEDSPMHDEYVYIDAVEDAYLKVEIVIYAKDYSGASDSRVITHYVYT